MWECSLRYLADLLNSLKSHVCQHVRLDAPQEDIVVHFVYHFLILEFKSGFIIETIPDSCLHFLKLVLTS